ncbi:hypothetical protein EDD16DRAFT_602447 [Pisolithus croceorrhizus]|nr:hypothetical protein EDD16DRAFT_602447 [Pisolithus croceorrhizus]
MPVPVPSLSAASPALKHPNAGNPLKTHLRSSHHHGRTLSLSAAGIPLSLGGHDQRLGLLHPWEKSKLLDDYHRPATAVESHEQGFRHGLAGAVNVSAIKGGHAEACTPPSSTAFRRCDLEVGSTNLRPWTASHVGNQVAPTKPASESGDGGQLRGMRGWSSTPNLCMEDETGVFAPLLEDDSSDLVYGDLHSSPIEPLTPFGEYVDRAVASSDTTAIYDPLVHSRSRELPIAPCGSGSSDFQLYLDTSAKEDPHSCESQSPPTATLTYKRLAEPIADWVITYVWKVCTNGIALPQSTSSYTPANAAQVPLPAPLHLSSAVHSLLMSTLLQPSAILLALWYIARLPVYFGAAGLGPEHVKERRFRVELFGDTHGHLDGECREGAATFRLIVLGFMLANKWLDDHTFSNKTWHTISQVPVQSLNKLEYFALDILAHDLSISPSTWSEWLNHLLSYHHSRSPSLFPQPISRPSSNPHSIIRRSIQEIMEAPLGHSSDEPVFLGVESRLREKFSSVSSCGDWDSFDIDLDEDGPLREEYLPKRRASNGTGSVGDHRPLQLYKPPTGQSTSLLPPVRWSPPGNDCLSNRNGAVFVATHPPLPTRYVAAPAMYPIWPTSATFFPPKNHADGEYTGNYLPLSHDPCWCPAPRACAPQQTQLCYCTDLYPASSHSGGYFQGRLDHCCTDIRVTPPVAGYPAYMATTWGQREQYGNAASRKPFGPHPPVTHQTNWFRA